MIRPADGQTSPESARARLLLPAFLVGTEDAARASSPAGRPRTTHRRARWRRRSERRGSRRRSWVCRRRCPPAQWRRHRPAPMPERPTGRRSGRHRRQARAGVRAVSVGGGPGGNRLTQIGGPHGGVGPHRLRRATRDQLSEVEDVDRAAAASITRSTSLLHPAAPRSPAPWADTASRRVASNSWVSEESSPDEGSSKSSTVGDPASARPSSSSRADPSGNPSA